MCVVTQEVAFWEECRKNKGCGILKWKFIQIFKGFELRHGWVLESSKTTNTQLNSKKENYDIFD